MARGHQPFTIRIRAGDTSFAGTDGFAKSYFEFGKVRDFEGTVVERPYPTLIVSRPGHPDQGDNTSEYLLVAPGKHGADDLVRSFDGKRVYLRGQLIYRDGKTMVEIEPGSIRQDDTHPPRNFDSHWRNCR